MPAKGAAHPGGFLDWFSGPGGVQNRSLFQTCLWTSVVFARLIFVAVLTNAFFAIEPDVLRLPGIGNAIDGGGGFIGERPYRLADRLDKALKFHK